MNKDRLLDILNFFFFCIFEKVKFDLNLDNEKILIRLLDMEANPINVTHLNQIFHLVHEAGVTEGFFKYYFLTVSKKHPYRIDKLNTNEATPISKGISSLEQLEWGLRRFHIDALLFFGNIRSAYRYFRVKEYEEIESFFDSKRIPYILREKALPFCKIDIKDRHLISEIASKAFLRPHEKQPFEGEQLLIDAYNKQANKQANNRVLVSTLCDKKNKNIEDRMKRMMLELVTYDIKDEFVCNEADIHDKFVNLNHRHNDAYNKAVENTRLFLSLINELDVYVATSMRMGDDFEKTAKACDLIFHNESIKKFELRYFDPTISATECHEDKGLIECLMVKRCQALIYFAGAKDSFGKDAEVAMALSLGKPAIIICPEGKAGKQRYDIFKSIHPLSRLIDFKTGVACGAIITQDKKKAVRILERIFNNSMEYDLDNSNGDGYFRLRERLTGSVVRLQTSDRLLTEMFWNYYHGIQ